MTAFRMMSRVVVFLAEMCTFISSFSFVVAGHPGVIGIDVWAVRPTVVNGTTGVDRNLAIGGDGGDRRHGMGRLEDGLGCRSSGIVCWPNEKPACFTGWLLKAVVKIVKNLVVFASENGRGGACANDELKAGPNSGDWRCHHTSSGFHTVVYLSFSSVFFQQSLVLLLDCPVNW